MIPFVSAAATLATIVTFTGATGATNVIIIPAEREPLDPFEAELLQMAAESDDYWTRREAERIEGHRLAARAVRRRPPPACVPVRSRRRESPRCWTQAVRAFRGRVS
jgi:hypothetical protein